VFTSTRYQHTILPDTLIAAGYTDLHIVKEQAVPDGDSYNKISNPEKPALARTIS
jgi:phosphoglucomutase